MRVLLVEPPKIPWPMMGDVVAPPLGLAQLAGCLEQAHVPVEILDANALELSLSKMAAVIGRRKPNVIGMTVYTPYAREVGEAVRMARQACPGAKIVLGGPHATFTAAETLDELPEVDIIARGEGDSTIVALARALEGVGQLRHVPGITYRRNRSRGDGAVRSGEGDEDGDYIETPMGLPVDVRGLPLPAFHLLPMDRYRFPALGGPFATVLTSRGCPFTCTFCSEWAFWRGGWRAYEPERVVDQLDILVNGYGRSNIWIGDDCFNVSGDHMEAICEGILERGIRVQWYYQGRADMLCCRSCVALATG